MTQEKIINPAILEKKISTQRSNFLRGFNVALSLGVATLGLYLAVSPFWPNITLWYTRLTDQSQGFTYQSKLAEASDLSEEAVLELPPPPPANRLLIPKIGVDSEILEGQTAQTLDYGIWRRPKTSNPEKGGNTVLTGHRWLYQSGPNTFYHLDKLAVGDQFAVFWETVEYDYEIFDIKTVPPSATEIEQESDESIVTLYTCAPLLSAKNRLVVRAKLVEL